MNPTIQSRYSIRFQTCPKNQKSPTIQSRCLSFPTRPIRQMNPILTIQSLLTCRNDLTVQSRRHARRHYHRWYEHHHQSGRRRSLASQHAVPGVGRCVRHRRHRLRGLRRHFRPRSDGSGRKMWSHGRRGFGLECQLNWPKCLQAQSSC
jgi:hypothetical protein